MAEYRTGLHGSEIPGPRVQLNARVPGRFPSILGQIAELHGTTIGAIVNRALEEIIAKNADALLELSEERRRSIDEDAGAELAWLERMAHERAVQQANTED